MSTVPARSPQALLTATANICGAQELRDRAKAVLSPGSRLEIAAADFDSSEQFMTVAHAARNTKVPFMVLKDRVLNQDQSLAEAIREFDSELDANAEVTRARAVARSDLEIAG
jgi:hypothetical protein